MLQAGNELVAEAIRITARDRDPEAEKRLNWLRMNPADREMVARDVTSFYAAQASWRGLGLGDVRRITGL